MTTSIRRTLGLPVILALFALASCSSTDSETDAASVPSPPAKQAAFCRALQNELPKTVGGMKRQDFKPTSDFTAAWGRPAISLRCGVKRPLILTRGYKHYNPEAPTVEVDGVEWMPEELTGGGIRCTTSKREAWVEVIIPKAHAAEVDFSLFEDLADAIKKTIPYGII